MNIDPNVYPNTYHISVNDAISGINVISFSKNMAVGIIDGDTPMGEPLNNSNCYAGFDPNAKNVDCGQNLQCSLSVNPNNNNQLRLRSIYSKGKTNLRWMIKTVSSGNNVTSYILRWTNIPGTYQTIITPFNRNNQQTFYSQITKNTQNCYEGGSFSAVYDVFPVTEIDIDKIQVVPRFDITTLNFTQWDSDGNPTSQSVGVSRRYYNEIKPEDNTPQGEYYNADLWEKGFYDEFDENGKIISRTYVSGCECNLYYGSKRPNYNNTFSVTNNNMNNSYWNADGNRVVPNYTVMGLFPMREYYDELSGSVMLGTYPGIQFAQDPTYYQSDNIRFTYSGNAAISSMSPAQGSNMLQRGNTGNSTISLNTDSDSLTIANTLICPRFVGNGEIEKTSNSTKFLFNEDGTTIQEGNNIFGVVRESYSIKYLWATIASWGIWVVSKGSFATDEDYTIGTDFPDYLYHGEVLENGTTTGVMLQGEDTSEIPVWENIEYEPITPGPSPEDGDDQGSNTGSVIRPTTLGVGGTNGFITQYSLTAAQIAEIGRLLWYKFSDASAVEQYVKNYMFFTVSTTGTLNLSNLLDYFVSLRVYPFPLINVPSHAAAGQDMWIGAGIVPLTFSTNLHTINNYADYIDAGSCTIPRYYNDFRDFAHTQIMLYLPYCGTVQLNPADVVGSTLHAQYAVDFATGGVTAYVDCTTWDGSQFVIAVLTGSIGADIPLTASNAAQIAARIAGDALNFAGTVGEAISSDVGRSAQAIGSAATGDVVGAAIGVANTYAGRIGGALDVAQTGLQIATAEGVKMPMLSGGRGFGSFGAPQTAYVQIRRGIYAEGQQPPQGFKEAYGEAYAKPVQVSSCAGFTVFANVDTSGLQCDAMEREQVKKMMQAGIYI